MFLTDHQHRELRSVPQSASELSELLQNWDPQAESVGKGLGSTFFKP